MPTRSSHFTLIILGLCIVGIAITVVVARGVIKTERQSLAERSATIAATIPVENVATLLGTTDDVGTVGYSQLKATLARIHDANSDIRFVYLLGHSADKKTVFFYMDSEDASSEDYSAPGDTYPEATQELHDSFDNGLPFVEGPVADRWGTWISGLAPIKDASGRVVGVVGIDVSAKEYYRSVITGTVIPALLTLLILVLVVAAYRVAKKNEEVLRLKSRFLSVASHELRSPLAGVVWGAESVLGHNSITDPKDRTMLEHIHDAATYMSDTVRDILDASRFAGGMENRIQREAIDLVDLVKSVAHSLALTGEQEGITVSFDSSFPERLPLTLDKEKMRRVFSNVIGNAIKYSLAGGAITIAYKLEGNEHVITVADKGIGIPADEQKHLFKTFYRASNAEKHSTKGTGMGLFFSKQLVELHGGRITLESEEDRGTTVQVALPAK